MSKKKKSQKKEKKELYEFKFLVSELTKTQASILFDMICCYSDSHGAVVGGGSYGVHNIDECEECEDGKA